MEFHQKSSPIATDSCHRRLGLLVLQFYFSKKRPSTRRFTKGSLYTSQKHRSDLPLPHTFFTKLTRLAIQRSSNERHSVEVRQILSAIQCATQHGLWRSECTKQIHEVPTYIIFVLTTGEFTCG